MDYAVTAREIVDKVGGESNIVSATHCMTRLRLVLKDEGVVDDEKVKGIPGVVGVMRKSGQYQIIIGNNVAKCYAEFTKLGNFTDEPVANAGKKKEKRKINPVSAVLDAISGSIAPIIPAIIGAGMIRVLYIILNFWIPAENSTMTILNAIADAAFYFLPILIAFSAGKKFGANPYLTAAVVGVLIHPNIIAAVTNATDEWATFLGIPLLNTSYSSTVLPALLTAYAMSWIEKGVDKITPAITKNFLKPMLIILISAPVALIILGPLGSYIGLGLEWVITHLNVYVPWLVAIIMAVAMPYLVMTGMHWAFIPVTLAALETPQGEMLMLPAMLAANLALGASCLAVAVRSKDKTLKQEAAASGVSAIFAGVTEPGLYGVMLPQKKPLIAVAVACFVSGLIGGLAGVAASAFASPSLLSITIFVHGEGFTNLIWAIVMAVVSIVSAFLLTLFIPEFTRLFNKIFPKRKRAAEAAAKTAAEPQAERAGEENKAAGSAGESSAAGQDESDVAGMRGEKIAAPLAGRLVSLSEVPDETFAAEILGKGAAIVPSDGKVYAPFAGIVESVAESRHALGLKSEKGAELLIHIGLETVELHGKFFDCRVQAGQTFKKGDLLLAADLQGIAAAGYNTITPVVVTNADEYAEVSPQPPCEVAAGDTIIKLE